MQKRQPRLPPAEDRGEKNNRPQEWPRASIIFTVNAKLRSLLFPHSSVPRSNSTSSLCIPACASQKPRNRYKWKLNVELPNIVS